MALRLPPSLVPPLRIASIGRISEGAAPRTFTSNAPLYAYKPKRKPFNPYAETRSRKRKEANIAHQAELKAEREAAHVPPVLGRPTHFTESLDAIPPPLPSVDQVQSGAASVPDLSSIRLNHLLDPKELPGILGSVKDLTRPLPNPHDPYPETEILKRHEEDHNTAVEAIKRIVALGNGSSADRTMSNKQMCIDMFGRHNTDKTLPRDPGAPIPEETGKTPRAGPDTGSSEVQAAILTVKIRALAKAMEEMGAVNKDKHNKRNLRLMVHRRQKLLKYLKRKEKGGIRYRNVMAALGLDDAAVEKELFL